MYGQPAPANTVGKSALGGWDSGTCSCFEDFGSCIMGLCCPCIQLGTIRRDVDDQSCCLCCLFDLICPCCATCAARTAVRNAFGIEGSGCGDFCAAICCFFCTTCQMRREVTTRKVNRAVGQVAQQPHYHQQQHPQQGAPAPVYGRGF
eukprot:ANDGO_02847.mRNA.1 Protein PLANT CADMIUM RESISTANCE 1